MTYGNNGSNNDAALTEDQVADQIDRVLADVQTIQGTYRAQRGKAALATMIASAFVLIETITADIDPVVQTIILDQHQVKKKAGSSNYTPWINCLFGEEKPGDKVKALDGHDYAPWEPNPSMAVYHHTMEELRGAKFDKDSAVQEVVDYILAAGGSQTMANARKKRIADRRKVDHAPTVELQRETYLANGPAIPVQLPGLQLPKDAGAFIGLVVERTEDGFVVRGLSERDASAKLSKLAAEAYDDLVAAALAAEELQRIEDEAEQRAYQRLLAEQPKAPLSTLTANSGGTRLTPEMLARAKAAHAAKNQAAEA